MRDSRVVTEEAAPLGQGEVRLAITKFALTSNNVTYAVTGDLIGYWGYFPREDGRGVAPVWGFGEVVESRHDDLPVGETVYGFLPMANAVVLRPHAVSPRAFVDAAPHRAALPGFYNRYARTADDPDALKALADERCLYVPLFATSFLLSDYLAHHDDFGAQQIVIGSASSKTGFGLAHMLRQRADRPACVVGLTSPGNRAFTEGLGLFDQVLTYDQLETLPAGVKTAFVDMSGDGGVRARLHRHFGEATLASIAVGATHWEADRAREQLPGARPELFFAPGHIDAREAELGRGAMGRLATQAAMDAVAALAGKVDIERFSTAREAEALWLRLVNNEVPGSTALIGAIASA